MNSGHWLDTVPLPMNLDDKQDVISFMDNLNRPGYLWDPVKIKKVINSLQGETLEKTLTFAARVFLKGEKVSVVKNWYEQSYGTPIRQEISLPN